MEDDSCTDCEAPATNNLMEIKCPDTGNNFIVIVDGSNTKKAVTEATCDSVTGKWAFKNGATPVTIEPAKVYCTTECAFMDTCEKPCTALTDEGARCKYVLNLLWDTFCESPAVNTLTQVTCPDTGNDALYVVDAADKYKHVTDANCDPATGKWVFKNGATPVTIDATKVFCSRTCAEDDTCAKIPCPILSGSDTDWPASCTPADCKAPSENSQGDYIACDGTKVNIVDAAGTATKVYSTKCNFNAGKWVFWQSQVDTITIENPKAAFCTAT